MANFIINTGATEALRLTDIQRIFIRAEGNPVSSYSVIIRSGSSEILFETASTLQDAQAKAAVILGELEA